MMKAFQPHAEKFECVSAALDYEFTLNGGWINTKTKEHTIEGKTAKACIEQLKYIKPCRCEDCFQRLTDTVQMMVDENNRLNLLLQQKKK